MWDYDEVIRCDPKPDNYTVVILQVCNADNIFFIVNRNGDLFEAKLPSPIS